MLNPSFEQAQPDTGTNCQYWTWNVPAGWTHSGLWGDADVRTWRARSGTNEATMHSWGGSGGDAGWWQETTNAWGAGSIWIASVWLCNDNGGWGGGIYTNLSTELKLEFYSGTYGPPLAVYTNLVTLPGETWTYFAVTGTAPSGSAWARWVLAANDQSANGSLQFDDVSLEVIPEPLAVALLGIGLAGVYTVRIRRK